MENLAGDKDCDEAIRFELTRCGIELVEGERSTHEVAASVTGKLGAFTFRRAWYYWIVEGPMPLDVARVLYANPVGKKDIRVNGHCGCPSPDEGHWAVHYDANGKRLAFDNGGKEPAQFDAMIAKGFLTQEDKDKYVFVPDPAAVAAKSFVQLYHVDSELGLYILAEAIRALPVAGALPPEAIAARDKAWAEIYAQSVEETVRQRDEARDQVRKLNPYADHFSDAKPPEDPLGRFLFGIRYYAGMLEDDDNWSHSLGHIQECCKEFDAAVRERAGNTATPAGPPTLDQPALARIFHELRAHRRRTWNRPADDEFEYWMRELERLTGAAA